MPDSKAIKERNLLDGGTEGIRWGEGEGEEDPSSQDRDGIGSARRGAAQIVACMSGNNTNNIHNLHAFYTFGE